MIMKYLPLKKFVSGSEDKKYNLKDRNGELYRIIEEDNLTHIFYYKNHNLDDDIDRLKKLNILNYFFELLDENNIETVNLIKKYKSLML